MLSRREGEVVPFCRAQVMLVSSPRFKYCLLSDSVSAAEITSPALMPAGP